MTIYVTTMYRHGCKESHHYIRYAGSSKKDAIDAGNKEQVSRGLKYDPVIDEVRNCIVVKRNITNTKLYD